MYVIQQRDNNAGGLPESSIHETMRRRQQPALIQQRGTAIESLIRQWDAKNDCLGHFALQRDEPRPLPFLETSAADQALHQPVMTALMPLGVDVIAMTQRVVIVSATMNFSI